MKRRDFIKNAAPVAAGMTLAGCSSSSSNAPQTQTRKKITWHLASSFPRTLDTIFGAAETLSQRVAELTDNQFRIKVHPAGEMVPGLQVLDAVQQNNVEIGHSAGYYYIGKNPALAFDTCLPFGLTARQQSAWLLQAGGMELMREAYADFNIINLPGGNTGAQMGGWFRNEINALADLKGRSMRIPGIGGKVMNELGVSVQVIAGGEIYPALDRGAIDAAEWVGPYDDLKLGLNKVAPFYYYPGWWEPGPSLSFYINQNAWNNLPASYRAALEAAAFEAATQMTATYDAQNPLALNSLIEQGTQLRQYPSEIMDAGKEIMDTMMQDLSASDPGYKKICDHWKAFRKKSNAWFGLCEQAYAKTVHRFENESR